MLLFSSLLISFLNTTTVLLLFICFYHFSINNNIFILPYSFTLGMCKKYHITAKRKVFALFSNNRHVLVIFLINKNLLMPKLDPSQSGYNVQLNIINLLSDNLSSIEEKLHNS